jgi:hypothetical protein
MTTTILKSEITKALTNINDKSFLEALYKLVNHEAEKYEYELSAEDMKIIEGRRKAYKAGKATTVTVGEMRKRFTKRYAK